VNEERVAVISPDSVLDEVGENAVEELDTEVVVITESIVVVPPDSVDDVGETVEQ
jgi:hypothetical protein